MAEVVQDSGARQDVLNPYYWWVRLVEAYRTEVHRAVFCCGKDRWDTIARKHQDVLARHVGDGEAVLDAGCGWGRILDLMPRAWTGPYLGLDLSPDFIDMARTNLRLHPRARTWFQVGDLRDLSTSLAQAGESPPSRFDLAVLVSIRTMVIGNCGGEVWRQMKGELAKYCRRALYLEYDQAGEGEVEILQEGGA